MVRFATLCDYCGNRSVEYEQWPTCRECHDHVCPDCTLAGSLVTGDGDGPDLVTCAYCEDDRPEPYCSPCQGAGSIEHHVCLTCNGKGTTCRPNAG
jgi:DnaJ-class molecular chaperone